MDVQGTHVPPDLSNRFHILHSSFALHAYMEVPNGVLFRIAIISIPSNLAPVPISSYIAVQTSSAPPNSDTCMFLIGRWSASRYIARLLFCSAWVRAHLPRIYASQDSLLYTPHNPTKSSIITFGYLVRSTVPQQDNTEEIAGVLWQPKFTQSGKISRSDFPCMQAAWGS